MEQAIQLSDQLHLSMRVYKSWAPDKPQGNIILPSGMPISATFTMASASSTLTVLQLRTILLLAATGESHLSNATQQIWGGTIRGNNISGSADYPIYLNHASYHVFYNNTFSNNGQGFQIENYSQNNQFYNNSFINNTVPGYVSGPTWNCTGNVFNLAAPTGGNYWSNYSSPDNNGDGFVDSPYAFDGFIDNLPWAKEAGWLNRPPIANAGPDQAAFVNANVNLDGSASSDPDGNPITYHWQINSKPADSNSVLSDANIVNPTFIPDKPGNYTIQLVVTDSAGAESIPDVVVITAENNPPVANAGNDQTIHPGSIVTLDGSASFDPDRNYPLGYAWQIVSQPAGSNINLLDATKQKSSFLPELMGDYVFELVVTDSLGASSTADTVLVSTHNTPPVADAGEDQAVIVIDSVIQLDGSGSWDNDGDLITKYWTILEKPEGSNAVLSNPTFEKPTFVADVHGSYSIQLVVSDEWSSSQPDTVVVTFTNVKPVADSGGNQAVGAGLAVTLDGSKSHDGNGDLLTYKWVFVSKPEGSAAVLADSNVVQTTFTADVPGDYVVSLVVNDGFEDSLPSNATITVVSNQVLATETLMESVTAINVLLPTSFKNKNQANPLTNKINAAITDIEAGYYADAINKLTNDVLQKTDGCATSGAPDKNDWIITCEAQNQIYPLIVEAINYLNQI